MTDRNRVDRVTTRHGDSGQTSLGDGIRYAKNHPRIELVGVLDELNCALGQAREQLQDSYRVNVETIQSRIFDLGAAVATGKPQPYWSRETKNLEVLTAQLNDKLEPLKEFVLPGGSETSARLHVARSLARRAERVFWEVGDETLIEAGLGTYLNRLSDYLFVLARSTCPNEVLWQPLRQ